MSQKTQTQHMKTQLLTILALAAGLLAPAPLSAQFAVDWFTVDGGGGGSGGGAYQLSGTAGQPEAGVLALGADSLVGGYWSVALEGPPLAIQLLADLRTAKVSWPRWASEYVLEQRVALPGLPEKDWPDVPPETYQVDDCDYYILVPAPAGTIFYRLHKSCPAP
jgi:hypothetical protein